MLVTVDGDLDIESASQAKRTPSTDVRTSSGDRIRGDVRARWRWLVAVWHRGSARNFQRKESTCFLT